MRAPKASPLHFSNKSHVGCVREVNEDFFGSWARGDRRLFVVADGMGGEQGGFEASRTAVEAVRVAFEGADGEAPADFLRRAVGEANAACRRRQTEDAALAEMGTTLDLLLIEREALAWWAHVGDSRVVLVRGGQARALTDDHTLIQQMLKGGLISEAEAREHPKRHVLNRVVGRDSGVEPDVPEAPLELQDGDAIVMCTDGLTDLLSSEEVAWFAGRNPPQRASDKLVALALQRGGHDNVTVQVIYKGRPPAAWKRITTAMDLRVPTVRRRRRWRAVLWVLLLVLAGAAAGAATGYFYFFRNEAPATTPAAQPKSAAEPKPTEEAMPQKAQPAAPSQTKPADADTPGPADPKGNGAPAKPGPTGPLEGERRSPGSSKGREKPAASPKGD